MGSYDFVTPQEGADVEEAFNAARDQAAYDYGHSGYTGTIAEKGGYTVITRTPMSDIEAHDLARKLIEDCDPRIDDKWGPAGAIPVKLNDRTVRVEGLSGSTGYSDKARAELLEAAVAVARKKRLIRRGEKPVDARLIQYSNPPRSDYGSYVTRYDMSRFVDGVAELTLRKGPSALEKQVDPDAWLFFGWASS